MSSHDEADSASLFLAAVLLLTLAAGADAAVKGPQLSVSAVGTVREAMICNGKLAGTDRDPVLLIHGTFADSEINWRWNYQKVLPEMRGETACTVDLPEVASGDAQLSTEYVVRAIRFMAERSERPGRDHQPLAGRARGALGAEMVAGPAAARLRRGHVRAPEPRRRVHRPLLLATRGPAPRRCTRCAATRISSRR